VGAMEREGGENLGFVLRDWCGRKRDRKGLKTSEPQGLSLGLTLPAGLAHWEAWEKCCANKDALR
jgi:hypothetical protein